MLQSVIKVVGRAKTQQNMMKYYQRLNIIQNKILDWIFFKTMHGDNTRANKDVFNGFIDI